jgi:uncharacterized membrane protein (DUF485 family)
LNLLLVGVKSIVFAKVFKRMNQNIPPESEADFASEKKSRLGLVFFFIYFFFYAGFVAIGVLNYELLAIEVVWGINLAIFYGIGLIVFAVLLGIVYNFLCSRYEDEMDKKEDKL